MLAAAADTSHSKQTPDTAVGAFIRRHPLIAYFLLTDMVSWAMWLPLVAGARGWLGTPIPFVVHYLGSLGPLLSALILTAFLDGRAGLRDLVGRMFKWRVGLSWVLVAGASPVALFAVAAVLARVTGSPWPDFTRLGDMNYLPDLGIGALALWIITFGFGEETGWRGYALPRLQTRRSALAASLMLAGLWVLWHVPSFLYLPSYTSLGVVGLVGLIIGIASGSVFFTWLYNSTRGSILMVALWHGVFDFFTASEATQAVATIPAIMSVAITVWATAIVVWAGPANLSRVAAQAPTPDSTPTPAGTPGTIRPS